jgi:hypothetical protein
LQSASQSVLQGRGYDSFINAIKSPKTKIAAHEDGSKHECPKAPWRLAKKGSARARAVKKEQLRRIDDYAMLADLSDIIRHYNSRLANYVLDLRVNKKHPESEGEEV